MSDVETVHPLTKYQIPNTELNLIKNYNNINNNNNTIIDKKQCSLSPKLLKNSELLRKSMSPGSTTQQQQQHQRQPSHSPSMCQLTHNSNNNNSINNSSNIRITSPIRRNSLSPASAASPRTMSPSPVEHHRNLTSNYISDGYQQSFVNAVSSPYTTNIPPKKSFCIDALLSKNQSAAATAHESGSDGGGDHASDGNRFLSDEDTSQKYGDDQREYTSSPEDGISRYVLVAAQFYMFLVS